MSIEASTAPLTAPLTGPPAGPPAGPLTEAERLARAHLSRIVEPGDERVGALLDRHSAQETLARLLAGPAGEGCRARAVGTDPVADLTHAHALGARLVCPGEPEWPTQLDDLGLARPIGLWVRGSASLRLLALRSVAVVGARACTAYGTRVAADLAAQLADAAWVVVSGGAYGIDAAAHRGALAATGVTIGVLACGVDQCYPRGHGTLLDRIAEQGLVVSELPLGAHPNKPRFLLRNRVIAALTRGTVVVEAARRSGSLSTARRARDLNRLVMGVPGSVLSELSTGVHALLRAGGSLVTDAAEVIELIGAIGTDLAEIRPQPVLPRDALGGEALRVLEAVPLGSTGAPVARLVRTAGLPSDTVLRCLYELGSLGLVERRGGSWRLR